MIMPSLRSPYEAALEVQRWFAVDDRFRQYAAETRVQWRGMQLLHLCQQHGIEFNSIRAFFDGVHTRAKMSDREQAQYRPRGPLSVQLLYDLGVAYVNDPTILTTGADDNVAVV